MKKNTFQEGLDKAWHDYLKAEREKKYPNIMLLGISGAGKSSLVNCVFGTDEAEISNVAPETKGYCNFFDGHKYGRKINLIDTAGYELNQSDSYLASITDAINSKYNDEPIHIIWYCLSVANERIEEIDLRVLRALKQIVHDRLCVVFTHCDLDDDESTNSKAFQRILQKNGLNDIPTFEVSIIPDLKLQLLDLVQWSSEQLKDEDFRQSFIGSQMVDLELKRKEAERIIQKACLSVGALKVSELLSQDDKKKALAEHQMKMVMSIFSAYGIDCLAGITKKFEKTTSLVDLGNGFVAQIVNAIPKAGKFQKYIETAVTTGLTKVVGNVASNISYSYVEKHIKGIPVKFEDFYTDPESAETFAFLLDEAVSYAGNKFQGKDKKKLDMDQKGKNSSKKKQSTRKKQK